MTAELTSRRPGRDLADREQLVAEFRSLGLRRGQDLLVHCSLRQMGHVRGGVATVLNAVLDVAGPEATVVVPTHTTRNSLSSNVFRTATDGLGATEYARFVAAMPGFDPARTPLNGMGVFAEYLRTRSSASRSTHPQVSFAAIGPRARACTSVHDLDCHLGDRSPLGWLYAADAAILLLGVGYSVCTAFHLAEYRQPGKPVRRSYRCFTSECGMRIETEFTDIELDDSDFEMLGAALESSAAPDTAFGPRKGRVGAAACRLVPLRTAVDFACSWLETHRRRVVS